MALHEQPVMHFIERPPWCGCGGGREPRLGYTRLCHSPMLICKRHNVRPLHPSCSYYLTLSRAAASDCIFDITPRPSRVRTCCTSGVGRLPDRRDSSFYKVALADRQNWHDRHDSVAAWMLQPAVIPKAISTRKIACVVLALPPGRRDRRRVPEISDKHVPGDRTDK